MKRKQATQDLLTLLTPYRVEVVEVAPELIRDIFDVREDLDPEHLARLELAWLGAEVEGTESPPKPVIALWPRKRVPEDLLNKRGILTETFYVWIDGRHRGESWRKLYGRDKSMEVFIIQDDLSFAEALALAARLNQQTNQLPMSVKELEGVIRRLLAQKLTQQRIIELLATPALSAASIRRVYKLARTEWIYERCRAAAEDVAHGSPQESAARFHGITLGQLKEYLKVKLLNKRDRKGNDFKLDTEYKRTHKDFTRLRCHLGKKWGWSRGKDVVLEGLYTSRQWLTVLDKLVEDSELTREKLLDHTVKFEQWAAERGETVRAAKAAEANAAN